MDEQKQFNLQSGCRSLIASILGPIGFVQIPFGFYLAIAPDFGTFIGGVLMMAIGAALLWAAFRIWPNRLTAALETDTALSRLKGYYWSIGIILAVFVGIGIISDGIAQIPQAHPRDVIAALGAIGLFIFIPSYWLLKNQYQAVQKAQALDERGVKTTGTIIGLKESDLTTWITDPPNVGLDGFRGVVYTFKNGSPTVDESVSEKTFNRLRPGDRFTVIYLPDNPTISRAVRGEVK